MEEQIYIIVAAVLAIVGGIALYFTFLRKSNDGKFKGFWGWMYDFLTFKKMFIEEFLKVCYYIMTLFVILASLVVISNSFINFLLLLIGGIIGVRVVYEFALLLLIICRNTTNISDKLSALNAVPTKAKEKKEETTTAE